MVPGHLRQRLSVGMRQAQRIDLCLRVKQMIHCAARALDMDADVPALQVTLLAAESCSGCMHDRAVPSKQCRRRKSAGPIRLDVNTVNDQDDLCCLPDI